MLLKHVHWWDLLTLSIFFLPFFFKNYFIHLNIYSLCYFTLLIVKLFSISVLLLLSDWGPNSFLIFSIVMFDMRWCSFSLIVFVQPLYCSNMCLICEYVGWVLFGLRIYLAFVIVGPWVEWARIVATSCSPWFSSWKGCIYPRRRVIIMLFFYYFICSSLSYASVPLIPFSFSLVIIVATGAIRCRKVEKASLKQYL